MRSALGALVLAVSIGATLAAAPLPPQAPQQNPMQQAIQLLDSGNATAAIGILEQVIAARPSYPPARYYMGRALNAAGRYEEALVHLRTGLPVAADPAGFQLAIAESLFQLERLADARSALDAANILRPNFAPVRFRIAQICYRTGNIEAALVELDMAASLSPGWIEPPLRAAEIDLADGDGERAVGYLARALEIEAAEPTLWIRYADALAGTGDDGGAEEAYRRAIAGDPESPLGHLALGYFFYNGQRFELARNPLEEALQRAPGDPRILMPLAEVELLGGAPERALELINATVEAVEAGPAAAASGMRLDALEVKARILIDLRSFDEAAGAARELLDAQPASIEGLFALGTALTRAGDTAGREYLTRYQQLSDVREHRELGQELYRVAGNLDGAAAEFREALAIDPDDAASLTGLGMVELAAGDATAALETLSRARNLGADGTDWHREWVLALQASGRTDEANRSWQEARDRGLTLGPRVWAALDLYRGAC